jgi:hypothetical protein
MPSHSDSECELFEIKDFEVLFFYPSAKHNKIVLKTTSTIAFHLSDSIVKFTKNIIENCGKACDLAIKDPGIYLWSKATANASLLK